MADRRRTEVERRRRRDLGRGRRILTIGLEGLLEDGGLASGFGLWLVGRERGRSEFRARDGGYELVDTRHQGLFTTLEVKR